MESNPVHSIIRVALGAAGILLIPLVAMQFTDQVTWNRSDFMVAGTILFGTGLVYELVVKKVRNDDRRFVVGLVLAIAFLYLWAELAVGIFTSWGS